MMRALTGEGEEVEEERMWMFSSFSSSSSSSSCSSSVRRRRGDFPTHKHSKVVYVHNHFKVSSNSQLRLS
jgi:hypothetical protein